LLSKWRLSTRRWHCCIAISESHGAVTATCTCSGSHMYRKGLWLLTACLPRLSRLDRLSTVCGAPGLMSKAVESLHQQHPVHLCPICSETLKGTVKDMERLHIEALRSLSTASNLEAAATPAGPQPTAVECVEALQDIW
jgi:hypothetical protein